MIPIKRTSSERDETSQNSLGVADNFFKRMTPDKDLIEGALKNKVPNLGILSSLSASVPSLFGDFSVPRPVLPGGTISVKNSIGHNQPRILALKHQ